MGDFMKLNPDCIRDILLSVEEVTEFNRGFEYVLDDQDHERLVGYSGKEVMYHIRQCDMAGLLVDVEFTFGGEMVMVDDLSPAGHEFLANTRKSAIWEGVKGVAGEIGANSLTSLAEIAKQAVFALIKQHFGIT